MSCIALLAFAGTIWTAQATEPIQPTVDTRQRVLLVPVARIKYLAEMRRLLQSMHEITQAVANNDLLKVEPAARASGIAAAADVDPLIERQGPETFRRLGVQTHQGFDALAEQAKAGAARDDILKSLAQITAQCVACHAAYQLVERR